MQISIIFIICTCFAILISSRPLDEENSRETSDAEYEGNDDSKQEEYISEDQEAANDEVQRMVVNQEDKQESQNEFRHNNRDSRGDQNDGYKEVSDADLNDDKEVPQDNINLKHKNDFFSRSDHKIYHSVTNKAVERAEDLRDHEQKLGSRNSNSDQNTEYSGDLLFKISQENLNKERNEQIEMEDHPNLVKQHYSKMQQNKDSSDGRTYENTFNIRDRRETDDHQSEAKNSDESNESSIINNIKKLSDKDLENLLNALPEDKKAILRKIMDKREITKKAGAVDDHGLDSSKLESSFSIDSKTVSDLATDASETNKQNESEESSTKSQENENDPGKIENKSSLNSNTNGQTLEFNIEAATLSSYNEDTFKNDNKREVRFDEHKKELVEEIKSNDDSTDENSYDLASNQDAIYSDNEDWVESKGDGSNTQKREINKENDESFRSLEESFPNAAAYYDKSLNMEPLVRVKRTELKHRVNKRDLSSLDSEVPFVPGFQDKKCENIALNEFEDKSFSNNPASFVQCDLRIKRNRDASETNKQNESEESSTKSQENENDPGKIENKSSLNSNTNGQTLEFNIEAATLSSYNEDTFKNDNKREVRFDEHKKELVEEIKSNDDSTDENSYDLASNQDAIYSDNEDWVESKGDGSNTQKREINKENDESFRSLEESFPNAAAYYDKSLNMEPLVRVKRTELKHRVNKRDLSSLDSEVPFVPGFQDKKCENIALNEFEDKSFSNNPASFVQCDLRIKRNSVARNEKKCFKANNSKLNEDSEKTQAPQYSIGSNRELSSVKSDDGNIMHNSDNRNKIFVEQGKDSVNSVELIRSSRTIDPINNDSHFSSDNYVDTPNYQGEDSFESHLEKSENNLSRSKRI